MIAGCFFLLRLRPVEFTDDLFSFLLRKPKTLKEDRFSVISYWNRGRNWRLPSAQISHSMISIRRRCRFF